MTLEYDIDPNVFDFPIEYECEISLKNLIDPDLLIVGSSQDVSCNLSDAGCSKADPSHEPPRNLIASCSKADKPGMLINSPINRRIPVVQ